ncbi:MAG: hypothetical protein FWG73_08095 [Planctomycetaceae bacterium]|nr:hypothetical protein [Planctomycetaceae bacterium]
MKHGIDLTLQIIAKSKNKAAPGLLASAFQSTNKTVRNLAASALVSKRSGEGLDTIIQNFDPDNSEQVDLVNQHRGQLVPVLHNAIIDKDQAPQAFRLAYTQNFYEVLTTLATYCLNPDNYKAQSETDRVQLHTNFLNFLDKYTAALESHDVNEYHLLYNTVLPNLIGILSARIREYRFTKYELTLTVYLRLYPFLSGSEAARELCQQLTYPDSPICTAACQRLQNEVDPYLIHFIVRCLDRINPPPVITQVIAERSDAPFLNAFLKSITKPVSIEMKTNLSNLPALPWVNQLRSILPDLDAESQCGLILFLQNLGLRGNGSDLRACLSKIFEFGQGKGRLEALTALSTFSEADVIQLVWDAAADADPAVQMEALHQLSSRDVPNSSTRIIQFIESPHEEIRHTVLKLLPNFRFNRFMQVFEQLDDNKRRQMFDIVRQLDKQTPVELSQMLSAGEPIIRAKALLCVDYCSAIVPLLEDALCDVLSRDNIPKLRSKAADQLVFGRKNESRMTLVQALHRDSSPEVRAAAKQSLENRPTYWAPNGDGEEEPE